MKPDFQHFYQATELSYTLNIDKAEDKKMYIDFSSVRGSDIIKKLKEKITFLKPNDPTCALFTGHIGCGKSTELLRLKKELEEKGFHVVYFASSEDLEMTDVDIADVLLAIARRISQSLEEKQIRVEATGFQSLLQNVGQIFTSDVEGLKFKTPAGDFGFSQKDRKFSLSFGIGEITTKIKSDAGLRQKLNQFLGPKKTELLKLINQELIAPAIANLKANGKKRFSCDC